jgi:hypothetical protein
MSLTLAALVRKTQKAAKAETDPKKRAAILASLEAYKKTRHTIEKHESEEGGDEEEDEAEEAESNGDCEEAEEGGNETDRSDDPENDEDDDSEDEDEEEEEEEEEEAKKAKFPMKKEKSAKALLALAQQATGKRGSSAIGALAAMVANGQRALQTVEKIQRERAAELKASMIDAALSKRRITKHEARELRGKPMAFVRPFLEMRPKAIISTDEDGLYVPNGDARTGDSLPVDAEREIDMALAIAAEGKSSDERAKIRASMVDAYRTKSSATKGQRY